MNVGFLDEVIENMKSGVWDFTDGGACSNCGQCCSDLLPVSGAEIKKIQEYIQKHHIKESVHFLPTAQPVLIDLTCPFRDNIGKKCTIYEVRPAICRDFKCDKPKQQIEADKSLYHGKYAVISMRETFFKKKGKT